MLIQTKSSLSEQQIRTTRYIQYTKYFSLMHCIFLIRSCFERCWDHMFFQAWGTSGSSDRYLTTIKNSYKQGKLLGRVQEGGEEGTYPSDPYHTFQRGTRFFPTQWKKNKNHKSVSSTDLWHELRCFYSARHICFTQWVGLWAANVWVLNNYPQVLNFC